MNYGYFDDAHKEYVLTTPFTPIKWINYVGTLDFGGIIDNTGGSLICKGDPALNRITKYIAQMPQSDFKGSTLYVRIKDKQGNYNVFSPFFTPTLKKLDLFEHRVGLSYSTWIAEYAGVRVEVKVFVPRNEQVLLQDIKVTNISGESQEIDVIPVYEFTHFDALKQLTNADWVPQTMQVNANRDESGHIVISQYAFMKKFTAVNYVTADRPVDSFEGDRKKFLGNNEYGSWSSPLSLFESSLGNSECLRGDNIAALLIKLGAIAPGATERTCTQLGQQRDLKIAEAGIEKFRNFANVDAAFSELAAFWDEYLTTMQIDTPDAAMNSMLNVHNPRQCHTTKNWSRYLSLYQLGYGARGIGFRDSSQDLIGAISHMPEEGRVFAEKLLSVQKRNGSAMHQFFPLTMEANEGDSREEPELPDYYGDDHLWICQTVAQYVKETGNTDFLNKVIPFYEKDKKGNPLEEGSVWEHMVRAIEFTWNDRGQHGLPHLGFADWNDTVNLQKGAESMMVANLFGKAIVELLDLCRATGRDEDAAKFEKYYDELATAFNKYGWDGEWYVRYFKADGSPIGSKDNEKGQIYTNGQSWPVISGFATPERAKQALQSVNEKLNTANGIKLSYPGYNGYDPNMGGVTTYPPGAKENGGIFLHSNPWVMIAEAMVGNGDRAFEYYNQINPASKNDTLDIFESEPYCYPQNILGDEHPQFGLGRNAWLSGTSSWTYVAGTQWILGVRPSMSGLIIDPSIPKKWDGFKVTRKFRGALYNIEVKNPDHVSKGVVKMVVDGKPVEGNVVPVFESGDHKVEVTLG
ncbi:MAG: glycosyl transferase [Deltaproteobacteria bacterium]|nr:glycosyl transferase [Deltaproteobacteria bacterium]